MLLRLVLNHVNIVCEYRTVSYVGVRGVYSWVCCILQVLPKSEILSHGALNQSKEEVIIQVRSEIFVT